MDRETLSLASVTVYYARPLCEVLEPHDQATQICPSLGRHCRVLSSYYSASVIWSLSCDGLERDPILLTLGLGTLGMQPHVHVNCCDKGIEDMKPFISVCLLL